MTHELPAYSPASADPIPPYSPPAIPIRRALNACAFTNRRLSVILHSHAESSTPIFVKGAPVTGQVRLVLRAKEDIKELTVSVVCYRVVSQRKGGAQWDVSDEAYERPFLEVHTHIFPLPSEAETLGPGAYTWPFSATLPDTFHNPSDNKEYALPPTFHQRGLPEFIHYKVTAVVRRKGWAKLNFSLNIPFIYVPLSRPDAPVSHSVLMAYDGRLPLPLPERDPSAYTTTSFPVKGRLFDQHNVEFECQISLVNPAQYTLGQPFHFFLTFIIKPTPANHVQTQLLDLLTAPSSAMVLLVRKVGIGRAYGTGNGDESVVRMGNIIGEDIATAALWPAIPRSNIGADDYSRTRARTQIRTLQGEIVVPNAMTPGFDFPSIHLSYAITLSLPTPGLVITSPLAPRFSDGPNPPSTIAMLPISLTYVPAGGIKTESYAPPPTVGSSGGKRVAIMERQMMQWGAIM